MRYGNDDETIIDIDTDGNAILNEVTTKDGTLTEQMGRKSHITYGTTAPAGDALDGDMYIMLDANNAKVGTYLYISSAWVQIEGGTP